MKRIPYLTALLAILSVVIFALPGAGTFLEFTRLGTRDLELWRWITGHFAHFGSEHLVWDLAVFVAFGAFSEYKNRHAFLLTMASASVAISATVFMIQPE